MEVVWDGERIAKSIDTLIEDDDYYTDRIPGPIHPRDRKEK